MPTQKTVYPLDANWTLRAAADDVAGLPAAIAAVVPGCVHLDLLAHDLIADPYIDRNEDDQHWIGQTDWLYETTFDGDEAILGHTHVDLVCEGLDTIAEIGVNDTHIAGTQNMHRIYRFPVDHVLRPGSNTLRVLFNSPLRYAEHHQQRLGDLPRPEIFPYPYNFIRKMACNFGWDWGPTLITSGIWRSIYLEAWSGGRIAAVRPLVTHANRSQAVLDLHVDHALDRDDLTLEVRLVAPTGGTAAALDAPAAAHNRHTLTIEAPDLWYPMGYGEQPRYTLHIHLRTPDGDAIDTWSHRIGLRQVRLRTDEDDLGREFVLEINEQPILCKGANWIPDDCFPSRVDERRYRTRLQQAVDANMNILRVWGGGIYESDTFYDICDDMGILVWQDFAFACACYPEEEPFPSLVEAEARDQITRLSRFASLALWNGTNESLWLFEQWNWIEQVGQRGYGKAYYLDMLPTLMQELDPSRPYWPASPYSGSPERFPNDDAYGNAHVWDVWFERNYPMYREHVPRFTSEFGFQAPPTMATLQHAITDSAERRPDSATMRHHQKHPIGDGNNERFLHAIFPSPQSTDDWHYLMQVNQARALTLGMEWFRANYPTCHGMIYWQLNDCWPVISWSAVDGYGRKKPLWYATRRVYRSHFFTVQPLGDGGQLALFAHNDSAYPMQQIVTVQRSTFDGAVQATQTVSVELAPRDYMTVPLLPAVATPDDPSAELIHLAGDMDATPYFFIAEDKRLMYPDARFDAALEPTSDGYVLTITAHSLLRDVAVFVDRVDPQAEIEEQLVTLLPGETRQLIITSSETLTLADVQQPGVIRSVNGFGAEARASGGLMHQE